MLTATCAAPRRGALARAALPSQCSATACRYEGLTRKMVPHGVGVFTAGKRGAGAGLRECAEGDSYAGFFRCGFADGVGIHQCAPAIALPALA